MHAALVALAVGQAVDRAAQDFRDAVRKGSAREIEEKGKLLASINTARAVRVVESVLEQASREKMSEEISWIIVRAAASFSAREPLEELAQWVVRRQTQPLARDVMFLMQNNYSYDAVWFAIEVLRRGSDDLKAMAADQAGVLERKEAVPFLIEALKKGSAAGVRRRAAKALAAITGQDYGESETNWEGWWEANKDKDLQGASKSAFRGNVTTGLDKPRENEVEKIKRFAPEAVLVLRAGEHDPGETKRNKGRPLDHNFDHIEKILDDLEIPHAVMTKEEFEKNPAALEGRMMVLVNCMLWREHCVCEFCRPNVAKGPEDRMYQCVCTKIPPIHVPKEYKFSDAGVRRIRKFVDGGGYLFTEDWNLQDLLIRKEAWPELVEPSGAYPKDDAVPALPKSGSTSHPYLKRIFARPPKILRQGTQVEMDFEDVKHRWMIDADSPKIRILDPKRVVTLLVSSALGENGALALTFSSGDRGESMFQTGKGLDESSMKGGRVLHVMSHFGKQESEADEYSKIFS